jgi:LysR family transcriptional regulator, nitrogen assimilation regulatory protein
MELRQFKYYLAIVDSGSLSRAAQHLYVAQSALSKQLAELESELGVKLLVRSRTGVAMTDPGKVFYEYAQGITKQIADAQAAVHLSSESVTGSVVVALPQSTSAMLALPLLRAAKARYPNIAFHLNEELTGNMTDQLLRGRVDIAVFTDRMPREDVAFTPLLEEDFVWLHAANDPLAPPPGPVTLAQAVARPLVMSGKAHGQCTRDVVDSVLEAAGHPIRHVATEVNSVQIVKSAVEAGIGPTILPLGLAQREVEAGRLVARRIAHAARLRTLGLCVSVHLPATNAKRAVCKLVGDVVGELCDGGHWPNARRVGR